MRRWHRMAALPGGLLALVGGGSLLAAAWPTAFLTAGDTLAPRASPDGALVAVSYAPTTPPGTNQRRLALYDASGNLVRFLATTGQFGGGISSWSPDGKHLVFDKTRFGQAQGLYVVNAAGGGEHLVYNSPSGRMPLFPDWSPDGAWIVFGQETLTFTDQQIWKVRPDGTGAQMLYAGAMARSPRWSPDGTRIAFWRQLSSTSVHLFVMNADGTSVRQVTPATSRLAGDGGLAWSPDGSEIAYYHYEAATGAYSLRIVGLDGAGDRHLHALAGPPGSPWLDWARDGSGRLYFVASVGDVHYLVVDTTPPEIAAPPDLTVECIGPSGQAVSLGTPTVADDLDPSPDTVFYRNPRFPTNGEVVSDTYYEYEYKPEVALANVVPKKFSLPTLEKPVLV